jgi:LysM repeat protein
MFKAVFVGGGADPMARGDCTQMQKYLSYALLCVCALMLASCLQNEQGQAAIVPTDPNQAPPTFTPFPTQMPAVMVTNIISTEVVMITTTPDPNAITIVTATATDTPFMSAQVEPVDPDGMTATQIIAQSTANAEFALTQTAIAIFGVQPSTPTPFFLEPPTPTQIGLIAQPQATQFFDTIQPGQDCIHQVREGETLFRIALTYGLRVSDLTTRNNIGNRDLLSIGQRLTIPACGTTGARPLPTSTPTIPVQQLTATAVVAAGGNVNSIPAACPEVITIGAYCPSNVQVSTGFNNNVSSNNQPPANLPVGSIPYEVQEDDTLFQIALTNNTTVDILASINGIVNPDRIRMGDTIYIPPQGFGQTTTTTTNQQQFQQFAPTPTIPSAFNVQPTQQQFFPTATLDLFGAGGLVPNPTLDTSGLSGAQG